MTDASQKAPTEALTHYLLSLVLKKMYMIFVFSYWKPDHKMKGLWGKNYSWVLGVFIVLKPLGN